MKKYLNSITTPSGISCKLQEITNKEYKTIIKYAQGEDPRAFFECIDELILETVHDFNDFCIVDKIYVYIAFCFFSINASITIKNNKIGEQEISILEILNNVESSYKEVSNTLRVKDFDIVYKMPKKIIYEDSDIFIDYNSGLHSVNSKILNSDEINMVQNVLSENVKIKHNHLNSNVFNTECTIINNPLGDNYRVNLLSSEMLNIVKRFYSDDLDNFYDKIYNATQYLKLSLESFYELTPLETNIIFNKWIKDKTENKERASNDALVESLGL